MCTVKPSQNNALMHSRRSRFTLYAATSRNSKDHEISGSFSVAKMEKRNLFLNSTIIAGTNAYF